VVPISNLGMGDFVKCVLALEAMEQNDVRHDRTRDRGEGAWAKNCYSTTSIFRIKKGLLGR
jgi:hypothetical protein